MKLDPPPLRIIPQPRMRGAWRLVERNVLAYRRQWYIFASGLLEPILFLLSIGIGVGKLVGDIHVGTMTVTYQEFVASGLLATSAMNGAVIDTTFNFFVKYNYGRLAMLWKKKPSHTSNIACKIVIVLFACYL